MTENTTKKIAANAVVAALYFVLTIALGSLSYQAIQFRIAECLMLLCFFRKDFAWGLTIGCFLANLASPVGWPDWVFGTLATLIGAVGTWWIGKTGIPHGKRLALLPPILSNALIIPFVLKYAYGVPDLVPFMMLTVGLGEVLAVGVLGSVLMGVLEKYGSAIFRSRQAL